MVENKGRKMNTVKLKLVFDRKNKTVDSSKLGLIEVYIYDKTTKKKAYISTGIEVLKEQFKQDSGERGVIVKHPNKGVRNSQLDYLFRQIETFVLSDDCSTIADVHNWNKSTSSSISIIDFIESEVKRRNPSVSTIIKTRGLIVKLKTFDKIYHFEDLTHKNITDFDLVMTNNGLVDTTKHQIHTLFKSFIKDALHQGLLKSDPYNTFKPKRGKHKDPIYLTEHELNCLINSDISNLVEGDRLVKVKDLFVFQCLTGLAYVDLAKFKPSEIEEVDGYKVIKSNRSKTDQSFISVLLPEALTILEKYNYDLPIISNQKYNDYLKLLALYIVDENNVQIIKKNLTTHVARHTYATYLLNKNVPIEIVARCMGHSNTKMTQHYAKMMGKTVVSSIVEHLKI